MTEGKQQHMTATYERLSATMALIQVQGHEVYTFRATSAADYDRQIGNFLQALKDYSGVTRIVEART